MFLRLWTAKEGFLKYTGEGLGGIAAADGLSLLRAGGDGDGLAGRSFPLPDGILTVVSKKEALPLRAKLFSVKEDESGEFGGVTFGLREEISPIPAL